MSLNWIFSIIVAVVVFFLIYTYLIPMLPSPIGTIVLVLLVLAAIFWLVQTFINPKV